MIYIVKNVKEEKFCLHHEIYSKSTFCRDGVNLAIQALKDEGALQTLVRKWFIDSKCSADSEVTYIKIPYTYIHLLIRRYVDRLQIEDSDS